MEQFKKHIDFSSQKIDTFKEAIKNAITINSRKDFCMYTTGSYGRHEAGENSDLDLFFLFENEENKFSKIDKTLIDSEIILACRDMSLPEFSGDGEYLEMHNVKKIYSELGSRNDDYENFFTARMLLLLESKAIYNEELYYKIIKEIIHKYYGDFHAHEKNFAPIFLVNDVIRFWRTLCLNYEHNRNRKADEKDTLEQIKRKKSKAHIKNLKLKFSRKLTCYSLLINILYAEEVLNEDKIFEIVKLSPLGRLEQLSQINPNIKSKIEEIFDLYNWFLDITHKEETYLLKWISEEANRKIAFDKARDFAKLLFELMLDDKHRDKLLYFIM